MTTVVLALALAMQAPDKGLTETIDRLVAELSSDDVASRDAAERKLADLGSKAHEALKKHLVHRDVEVRARIIRLVPQSAIVPVADDLRPILAQIESESLDRLRSGVAELLKKERKTALETVKICAEQASGRLHNRCRQLVDILGPEAVAPLRYGIVVLEGECDVGGKLPGLEIFINESAEELTLKDAGGEPRWWTLEDYNRHIGGGGGTSGRRSGHVTFSLAPQGVRVDAEGNLATGRSYSYSGEAVPGARFAIQRTYSSNAQDLRAGEKTPWTGTRASNSVTFRYK